MKLRELLFGRYPRIKSIEWTGKRGVDVGEVNRQRDLEWCAALNSTLDRREALMVLIEFNRIRSDTLGSSEKKEQR